MSLALVRLLQLASPALPVGAYSYSQGLESACEAKIVRDKGSARHWINDVLRFNIATMEAPILARLFRAWQAEDSDAASYWNQYFLASRETMELRAETEQMGYSLAKLLLDGKFCDAIRLTSLTDLQPKSFPAAFSFAAVSFSVPMEETLTAYLWTWLEKSSHRRGEISAAGPSGGAVVVVRVGAGYSIPN